MSTPTAGSRRALLLENIHPDGRCRRSTAAGFDVEQVDRGARERRAARAPRRRPAARHPLRDAASRADLFEQADALLRGRRLLHRHQPDRPRTATARGVAVFNAPFSNTRSVVELVIAEIISLDPPADRARTPTMHAGVWDKSATGSHEVRGRTLGIIGYGNIGSQLSVLAEALGMRVFFYDTADKLALGNARGAARSTSCSRRPTSSRCTSTAGPATAACSARTQFAPDAAGRRCSSTSPAASSSTTPPCAGTSTVGHIAGAAVDVFPVEPSRRAATRSSPSCAACRTSSSRRTSAAPPRRRSRTSAVRRRQAASTTCTAGTTALSVNLPSVQLPRQPGSSRLLVPAPQPARVCWRGSTGCWPSTASTSSSRCCDDRGRRLRRHRRAGRRRARRGRGAPRHAGDDPGARAPAVTRPVGGPSAPGAPRTLAHVSDAADLPLIGAAALRARAAARVLRTLPTDAKDAALAAMADALRRAHRRGAGRQRRRRRRPPRRPARPTRSLDRLRLDAGRVAGVAAALRAARRRCPTRSATSCAGRGCPTGCSCARCGCRSAWSASSTRRGPNVTVDAAGLCLKSGNAALLRGSASALPHQHRAGRRAHRGRRRRPGCPTASSSCCRPTGLGRRAAATPAGWSTSSSRAAAPR